MRTSLPLNPNPHKSLTHKPQLPMTSTRPPIPLHPNHNHTFPLTPKPPSNPSPPPPHHSLINSLPHQVSPAHPKPTSLNSRHRHHNPSPHSHHPPTPLILHPPFALLPSILSPQNKIPSSTKSRLTLKLTRQIPLAHSSPNPLRDFQRYPLTTHKTPPSSTLIRHYYHSNLVPHTSYPPTQLNQHPPQTFLITNPLPQNKRLLNTKSRFTLNHNHKPL